MSRCTSRKPENGPDPAKPPDRSLRRAGLDYWADLDLRVVDSIDLVAQTLGRERLWSFSTKSIRVYTDASYRPGDGLVFGPESRGLPARWLNENRVSRSQKLSHFRGRH